MMLIASGLLAFAWIYSTVHAPASSAMGVTAPQPADSATTLARVEAPATTIAPATTAPVVSANPQAHPHVAPRAATRAYPRSPTSVHPAGTK